MICDNCIVENCSDRENKTVVIACSAYKKPPTNADRIRAMSDEELAKGIYRHWQDGDDLAMAWCDGIDKRTGRECYECNRKKILDCILRWLRQQAKEKL